MIHWKNKLITTITNMYETVNAGTTVVTRSLHIFGIKLWSRESEETVDVIEEPASSKASIGFTKKK